MGRSDSESVAATIGRATELPHDTGEGANHVLPQLFGSFPIPDGEEIVEDTRHPHAPDKLGGVPAYNLQSHLRRFIVGTTYTEGSGRGDPGEAIEHDDSAEYEALLNDTLLGKAILRWEEKSTLKDGTFVITVCYFTQSEVQKKRSVTPFEDTKS